MKAAAESDCVRKFILISYLACRRSQPTWWSSYVWSDAQNLQRTLPDYCLAKTDADIALLEEFSRRPDIVGVSLRPGLLSDEGLGTVELGKTKSAKGSVSRESVAHVAAGLIDDSKMKTCWLDLLDGDEVIDLALKRVSDNSVSTADGEHR